MQCFTQLETLELADVVLGKDTEPTQRVSQMPNLSRLSLLRRLEYLNEHSPMLNLLKKIAPNVTELAVRSLASTVRSRMCHIIELWGSSLTCLSVNLQYTTPTSLIPAISHCRQLQTLLIEFGIFSSMFEEFLSEISTLCVSTRTLRRVSLYASDRVHWSGGSISHLATDPERLSSRDEDKPFERGTVDFELILTIANEHTKIVAATVLDCFRGCLPARFISIVDETWRELC